MDESCPHDTFWKRDHHEEPNLISKRKSSTGRSFHETQLLSVSDRTSARNISVWFLLKSTLGFEAGHAATTTAQLAERNGRGKVAVTGESDGLTTHGPRCDGGQGIKVQPPLLICEMSIQLIKASNSR